MLRDKVLMCPPTHFEVGYSINPWMDVGDQPDLERAKQTWNDLRTAYASLGVEVQVVDPVEGLPDLVFTANGGLVIDGKVMLARFKHEARAGEVPVFERWFRSAGYEDIARPTHLFEGSGDALLFRDKILAGYGFRSEREVHDELASFFDREVVSIRLVDPRFYHVDTCLVVIDDDTIVFYPPAFDDATQEVLRALAPNAIEASDDAGMAFGLNAVSDGKHVVTSAAATSMIDALSARGYEPIPIDITEFQKSGGGVKCLTLELR